MAYSPWQDQGARPMTADEISAAELDAVPYGASLSGGQRQDAEDNTMNQLRQRYLMGHFGPLGAEPSKSPGISEIDGGTSPYTSGSHFDGHWIRNEQGQLQYIIDKRWEDKK